MSFVSIHYDVFFPGIVPVVRARSDLTMQTTGHGNCQGTHRSAVHLISSIWVMHLLMQIQKL